MSRVAVIGAGYVGLVSGVCLAELGHDVVCVDMDPAKLDRLRRGESPIHEEGLDELLASNLGVRLSVTDDLTIAVQNSDITLIAVGTPSTAEGIDLRYVEAAAAEIGRALREGDSFHVVVVKSTVVPGTTENVVGPIVERESGRALGESVGVASNPEFLTEGRAVRDFMEPDRIVVGVSDERSERMLTELYVAFSGVPNVVVNPRTAEMIKYASNALLATMISFSNELANVGAALGDVDTAEVMRGVHASQYLTTHNASGDVVANIASFLYAGCGFGGSCLPKDVTALAAYGSQLGVPTPLLDAVLDVNRRQPGVLVDLVRAESDDLSSSTVTVLGLAFKPDTSDVRESPAFPVIRALAPIVGRLCAHDPLVRPDHLPEDISTAIEFTDDLNDAVGDSDILVIVTAWSEYREIPEILAGRDPQPLVVDGRRMLDASSVARYTGIGI